MTTAESSLYLREVESHWFVCSTAQRVPVHQINFIAEHRGIDATYIRHIFERGGPYSSERRWHSLSTYVNELYANEDEKRLAYLSLSQIQSTSDIAKFIVSVINDDIESMKQLEANDFVLPLIFSCIDALARGEVREAYTQSLKVFHVTGFRNLTQLLPVTPNLSGFSLLLAVFDLFPQEQEELLKMTLRDMFFPGANLHALLTGFLAFSNYTGKAVAEEQVRTDLARTFRVVIKRLVDLAAQKIRNATLLLEHFIEFASLLRRTSPATITITTENQQQLAYATLDSNTVPGGVLASQEDASKNGQQSKQTANENWNLLRLRIQNGTKLTKREEETWRKLAFIEFQKEALLMFGEKCIILDRNPQNALVAYKILYSCGDYQTAGMLYSLLCYKKQWEEASIVAQRCGQRLKAAYCLLKQNKNKEASELIMDNSFKGKTEFAETILSCYYLSKCLFVSEERRFLAALTLYEVLRRDKRHTNSISVLFQLLVVSKLLERGLQLEQDTEKSLAVLRFAKKHFRPTYLYEYMTQLFIRRKIIQYKQETKQGSNVASGLRANSNNSNIASGSKQSSSQNLSYQQNFQQQSSRANFGRGPGNSQTGTTAASSAYGLTLTKKNKKSSNRQTDQQPTSRDEQQAAINWQPALESILETDYQAIFEQLESELQTLRTRISDPTMAKLKSHHEFLYTLGHSILYPEDTEYARDTQSTCDLYEKEFRNTLVINANFKAHKTTWVFGFLNQDALQSSNTSNNAQNTASPQKTKIKV